MTRSKPFSRNSAKFVLLFLSLLFAAHAAGCFSNVEPTYKEKDIPFLVKKICKEEYKLDVTTHRTGSTLWIYAPLDKILDKEYGIKEDKIFDEEIAEKLRNILTTISRVLISSDAVPQFFALCASDINLGIDYRIIGNVDDVKKSSAGFLPWTESNRRYVIKLTKAPEAIDDTTGTHVNFTEIKLSDFLADQIAQRIGARFQDEEMKSYFKIDRSDGLYRNKVFYFEYNLTQTKPTPKPIKVQSEVVDIISYCLKSYEFNDFNGVTIGNAAGKDTFYLNKAAIVEGPKK